MRVCIDATPLLLRSAGVKNYLYHWILHLRKLAGDRAILAFPFLNDLGELHHEQSVRGRWSTFARLVWLRIANLRGNPMLDLLGRRIDLFHASSVQVQNPPRNTRLTATLYDMTCWLVPETHLPANVIASKRFAERVVKRADGLIAISDNTRRDAVRILGLAPEKIRVIYPGVAEAFFDTAPEAIRQVKEKYALMHPYILFVGTVEPRKNVDMLLDAYQQLAASLRGAFELVLAGPIGWASRSTLERLHAKPPGVRYLGYVPERDLPALTSGATVFAYLPLYEGFGFPVAQAMAAGVPVITSNLSSLPEIAGDAALLVDPRSVQETRAALERLLLSPSLRAEVRNNGARRAGQYRWEGCARASLEFFEFVSGI